MRRRCFNLIRNSGLTRSRYISGGGANWMDNDKNKDIELLIYPNPKLKLMSEEVLIEEIPQLIKSSLISDMFDLMYLNDGVGLAAPQMGINKRFFVYNENGRNNKKTGKIIINPVIIGKSKTTRRLREACVSFPHIDARIVRHTWINFKCVCINYEQIIEQSNDISHFNTIDVGTENESFQYKESDILLTNQAAHIFQHEFDHLNGEVFIDKIYQLSDKKRIEKILKSNKEYNLYSSS